MDASDLKQPLAMVLLDMPNLLKSEGANYTTQIRTALSSTQVD